MSIWFWNLICTRGKLRIVILLGGLTAAGISIASPSLAADTKESHWPAVSKFITCDYGPRNVPDGSNPHPAVDIESDEGVTVFAADDGEVEVGSENTGKFGMMVIRFKSGRRGKYIHLREKFFKKGEQVKGGKPIGKTGAVGTSVSHLDYSYAGPGPSFNSLLTHPLRHLPYNDTGPPTIEGFTGLSEGQSVSGVVRVKVHVLTTTDKDLNSVSLSGAKGITPAEVSFDPFQGVTSETLEFAGSGCGGDDTFIFLWDTTQSPEGSVTLTAAAKDANGQTATKTITLKVAPSALCPNDTTPPAITWTSPSDGAFVNQPSLTLSGNITDNCSLQKVEVSVNGVSAFTKEFSTAAKTASFDLSQAGNIPLTEGHSTLTITAVDFSSTATAGNKTTLTRSVFLDTQKPRITVVVRPFDPAVNAVKTVDITLADPCVAADRAGDTLETRKEDAENIDFQGAHAVTVSNPIFGLGEEMFRLLSAVLDALIPPAIAEEPPLPPMFPLPIGKDYRFTGADTRFPGFFGEIRLATGSYIGLLSGVVTNADTDKPVKDARVYFVLVSLDPSYVESLAPPEREPGWIRQPGDYYLLDFPWSRIFPHGYPMTRGDRGEMFHAGRSFTRKDGQFSIQKAHVFSGMATQSDIDKFKNLRKKKPNWVRSGPSWAPSWALGNPPYFEVEQTEGIRPISSYRRIEPAWGMLEVYAKGYFPKIICIVVPNSSTFKRAMEKYFEIPLSTDAAKWIDFVASTLPASSGWSLPPCDPLILGKQHISQGHHFEIKLHRPSLDEMRDYVFSFAQVGMVALNHNPFLGGDTDENLSLIKSIREDIFWATSTISSPRSQEQLDKIHGTTGGSWAKQILAEIDGLLDMSKSELGARLYVDYMQATYWVESPRLWEEIDSKESPASQVSGPPPSMSQVENPPDTPSSLISVASSAHIKLGRIISVHPPAGEVYRGVKWSPDGSRLLTEGSKGLYLINRDGSNVRKILPWDGYPSGDYAWSPDGKKIVFLGGYEKGSIYVRDVDTDQGQVVVQQKKSVRGLHWNPDGSIVYADADAGEIVTRDAAGRVESRMKIEWGDVDGTKSTIKFSRDGWAFFTHRGQPYRAHMKTKAKQKISSELSSLDYPSPDGRKIVAYGPPGKADKIVDLISGRSIPLPAGFFPGGVSPWVDNPWSPDSRFLLGTIGAEAKVIHPAGTVHKGSEFGLEAEGDRDIYAFDTLARKLIRVTNTPDLRTFLLDGKWTEITDNAKVKVEDNPSWSPDGRFIAYEVRNRGTIEIAEVSVEK